MSLPRGYKRLEYIQSTGTQYVDTGVVGKSGLTVDTSVTFLDISGEKTVFGCLGNSKRIFLQQDSSIGFLFAHGSWNKTSFNPVVNQKYKFTARFFTGNQSLFVDNESVYSGTDSTKISTGQNVYLLSLNIGGSASSYFIGKLFTLKIYDNDVLVRDFVPCQKPDGSIGLWDNVNSVFYGNAGTGTFTAGPIMEPPASPTNLQQTMAVRLAWSAVDGATVYNVYRDGTLLGSTTETTFIDLTAAENTEYIYAVSAVGSGGESAKTTLTVYTKSGYFLYKPYVESATFQ